MKKVTLLLLLISLRFAGFSQNQISENKPVNMTVLAEYEKLHPPVLKQQKISDDWEEDIVRNTRLSPNNPNIRRFNPQYNRTSESPIINSPLPNNDFNALDDNGSSIPPDIDGCVGANHLMVTLNSEYRIMNKSGTVISTVSPATFWSGVTPAGHSDPHVHFDHITNRWIIVAQSSLTATSSVLVAVSQTNDPTGIWNRYSVDVDAAGIVGLDFPLVGYNQNWLVVTGNMFNVTGGAFADIVQIYIFDMANLNAGGAVTLGTNAQLITTTTSDGSFALSPSTNYDGNSNMYLLEEWNGGAGALRETNLTGTIPAVTWNGASAAFPVNGSLTWQFGPNPAGDFAPQKTEARKIAVNDARMNNVILRNGKLWTAHHILLPGTGTTTRAAIQWWVITAATSTPVQIGLIDDATGVITRTFPSVAVDGSENMIIGYSIFSSSMYASAAYSYRQSCTAANTMQNEVIYKNGLSSYFKNFGGTRDRWGDYSNCSLDPSTGRFWVLEEYANQRVGAADNDSRWGSWWAEVALQTSNGIFFANSVIGTIAETNSAVTGCRKYKDYTFSVGVACAATGNATVTFGSSGTATTGQDFDIIPSLVSYTNGDGALKNVTLRVYDDDEIESTENVTLNYTISGAGVVAGTGGQLQTITITDNEIDPATGTPATGTIGSNNVLLGNTSPFQAANLRAKYQMLYLASELTAKGFVAGPINSLSFTENTRANGNPVPYNGFTISMANTLLASLSTFVTTGFTQVYSANYSISALGPQLFNFSTNFVWDGTSNIIVQTCFDNTGGSTLTANDIIYGTSNALSGSVATLSARNAIGGATTLGCNLTTAGFTSTARPDITLTQPVPSTIAPSLTNNTVYLGPNATVYIYSGSQIMAKIVNNTSFDYGCTQVIIDRDVTTAGAATKKFWNNSISNYLLSKTFRVIPANVNASGNYTITLYYTASEVSNWQTATGKTWAGFAKIVKIKEPNTINSITPASPPSQNANIEVNLGSTPTAFGSNYQIAATFSTGFSGFGVGDPGGSLLPVNLLTFDGHKENNTVALNWKTAFEFNNKEFEIETGKEINTFYKIGMVNSQGNSTIDQSYGFTDNLPQTGVNYYRLKQVDLDGNFSYSRTIAITFDKKGRSVTIYPNPAKEKLVIGFAGPKENVIIRIISFDGKEVKKENAGNIQRTFEVSLDGLIPGAYIIEIRIGKEKHVVEFIKE